MSVFQDLLLNGRLHFYDGTAMIDMDQKELVPSGQHALKLHSVAILTCIIDVAITVYYYLRRRGGEALTLPSESSTRVM